MSFFDRLRNWLGEEPTVPLIPIREHRSCKDDPCYYYEAKDGYYGYCNKMGKNLRINLAPTCHLRLGVMRVPEETTREILASREKAVKKGEDNTLVTTNSQIYILKKTLNFYNVPSGKAIEEVFWDLYGDEGSGYYMWGKITSESPTVAEKTEAEEKTSGSLIYVKSSFSKPYYGDWVRVRLYLKSEAGGSYYAKNSLDQGFGKVEVEYVYKV